MGKRRSSLMIVVCGVAILVMTSVTPALSIGEPGGRFNPCLTQSYYDSTHTNVVNQCGEALFIVACNNDQTSNCKSLTVDLGESSNVYTGRNGGSFAICKRGEKPVDSSDNSWTAGKEYFCK